jgi:glucokinase
MARSAATYLGIEIGGTKLQIVAGDGDGRITRRWRATVDRERGGPGICKQILQGLQEMMSDPITPSAIGVGFDRPLTPDPWMGRIRIGSLAFGSNQTSREG